MEVISDRGFHRRQNTSDLTHSELLNVGKNGCWVEVGSCWKEAYGTQIVEKNERRKEDRKMKQQ